MNYLQDEFYLQDLHKQIDFKTEQSIALTNIKKELGGIGDRSSRMIDLLRHTATHRIWMSIWRSRLGKRCRPLFFLTFKHNFKLLANCWQALRAQFSAVSTPTFASQYIFW